MQFIEGPVEYEGEMIPAKEAWDRWVAAQSDGYGRRIFSYAKDWAEGIEARLANGEQLIDAADDEARKADTDGITGFMYGAAVSSLSGLWLHGEALRRWHNKETQLGTEGDKANESGGVLNPALLNIG